MKKIILILFTLLQFPANAKDLPHSSYWHGEERTLRYKPEGEEFVITNGNKRFTRAIYGTNTGFRFKPVTSPNSDFTCLTSVEVYIWLYLPPQILLG